MEESSAWHEYSLMKIKHVGVFVCVCEIVN